MLMIILHVYTSYWHDTNLQCDVCPHSKDNASNDMHCTYAMLWLYISCICIGAGVVSAGASGYSRTHRTDAVLWLLAVRYYYDY